MKFPVSPTNIALAVRIGVVSSAISASPKPGKDRFSDIPWLVRN
jgi:hypothetical protein